MTSVFESLGLGHLDWHGKAELLERMRLELEELPAPSISPEFLNELERRGENARLHPETSVDGEEFFKHLLKELGE